MLSIYEHRGTGRWMWSWEAFGSGIQGCSGFMMIGVLADCAHATIPQQLSVQQPCILKVTLGWIQLESQYPQDTGQRRQLGVVPTDCLPG